MTTPILATKLYIPPLRPHLVRRPRLIERLNEGLRRKLTLISAPAGCGKTTLVSEWLASCKRPAAWLSLDEGDSDLTRLLTYVVAALRTLAADIGAGVLGALQSPQPPPPEAILTILLNDMTTISEQFVLVLDDYHTIDTRSVDRALTFVLEHLPPQMHLVIATRETPQLALARLRARDQLTELRATDLRFTPSEATAFLKQVMGLALSADDIAALERRTEGWIAGLQFAAISLQGHLDPTRFITSFTGSHHFVLDYLVEEVLQQQPERVQTFLLRTSILDRLCGPLCDAVALAPAGSGQATLEYLEHANLFLVPLDDERQWYRYHHLFADLLRRRLQQGSAASVGDDTEDEGRGVVDLHRRASRWYEEQGLELEAFHHAAAAHDVERAVRLIEGNGMPLHFRGEIGPVLRWLESLPSTILDAWPTLWIAYASVLLGSGQTTGVEEKLQAAEKALEGAEPDEKTRDLIGRIAASRATAAVSQNQVDTIIAQSHRALAFLAPDNLAFRTSSAWKLGFAYQLQGDRAAARQAYTDVIAIAQASGNTNFTVMATIGLGTLQEADNQLYQANQTYQRVLQLLGEQPVTGCEAHLGLARICYEWNDLAAAEQHGHQSLQLARQHENTDRFVACEVVLARLKLAQGDARGAAVLLARAGQSAREHAFVHWLPEVAAAQVLVLLCQGNLEAAARLAKAHDLPISQARVHLAEGDPSAALAALEAWRERVEAKGWEDERLKVLVLQAVALQAQGEQDQAVHILVDALSLAEPGGFIRLFVDEGLPMAQLLSATAARGIMRDYIRTVLAMLTVETQKRQNTSHLPPSASLAHPHAQPLIEPLSYREVEVLRLIAQGCSNQEISEQLFLALSTVKGHNRKIFDKLHVQRRTEAVARARELGML
jgi:LuxR family maltose regulon positive regulatory protein